MTTFGILFVQKRPVKDGHQNFVQNWTARVVNYPAKLHGIAIQTKFATHVRWIVLPFPHFSPAIVLVDEHGEEGNDVLSPIVRNLSIDECLFNKRTIVQRMDNLMS